MASKRVFVSYVQENIVLVSQLVSALRSHAVNVWFDKDALPPGVFWRDEIRSAVKEHECFIACFSDEYAARERTFMNEELELAIEEIRLRGMAPWFIPVLLSGDLPDRAIGAGRTLRDIQFVDLRSGDVPSAVERILRTLRRAEVALPPPQTLSSSSLASFADSLHDVTEARRVVEPFVRSLNPNDMSPPHGARSSVESEMAFVGSRQDATDPFKLEPGLWRAELSHAGDGHFGVWLLSAAGDRVTLLVNETGAFNGSKLLAVEQTGEFVFDVSANGMWEIRLVRPSRSSPVPGISGTNQASTSLLRFAAGLHKFRLSHRGVGHFSVWVYDTRGKRLHLLVNETGDFSGSKAVKLDAGDYAFDVSASGPWSISWQ